MFNRVYNLVDELHRDTRDYAFRISEGTLEGAECNSSFLGGYPREELRNDRVQ